MYVGCCDVGCDWIVFVVVDYIEVGVYDVYVVECLVDVGGMVF